MRMVHSLRFGLVVLVGSLLVGCGSAAKHADPAGDVGSTSPSARAGLDLTYVVTGVTEAGKKRMLVRDSEIRFIFKDGRLGITAGCNSMSGAYRIEGSRLTVESLATTEMGCEEPLMAQDTWVAGLFAEPVQLSTGNDAAIISGDVVLELTDREVVSPDKPLVGTKWFLDSVGSVGSGGADGAVSSVPQGEQAWLQIEAGVLTFELGCTGGTGAVEVENGRLKVADLMSRATPCPPGSVFGVFTQTVSGDVAYTIEEKVLTITKGDRSLGFRAR